MGVDRVKNILVALALLSGVAHAQNYSAQKFRLMPQATTPIGPSTDVFLWSNSSNSNHPTLHLGGADYDLLYTLGGLPVSTSVPNTGYGVFYDGLRWTPRLLAIGDLTAPGLIGNGSSQVAPGNDSRFPPTPSAAGSVPYDNGSGYSKSSPGTSSQVYVGGTSPAFGNVPDAALSNVGTAGTYGDAKTTFIGKVITDAKGRVSSVITHAKQVVNIADYGAVADRTCSGGSFDSTGLCVGGGTLTGTDNTAAIQAAVDTLRDTGGVVWVPETPNGVCYGVKKPGIQLAASAQHPYNNIVIMGAGKASCIGALEAIGTNNGVAPLALLYFNGLTNFTMTNVGIDHIRITGFDRSTLAGPLVLWSRSNGGFMVNSWLDNSSTEGAYWNSPTSDVSGICMGNHASYIGGYGVSPPAGPLSPYNVNTNDALLVGNFSDHQGECAEIAGTGAIAANNIFSYIGSGVGGTNNGTCLKFASSVATGRSAIVGNTIRHAAVAVQFSVTSGTGNISISGNVFENVDQALSATNSIPILFSNNSIYDTETAGSGSSGLVDHASSSTAPMAVTNNIVAAGLTGTWAYFYNGRDAVTGDLVARNFTYGNGYNAAIYNVSVSSTGWNTEFVDNTNVPLTMGSTFPRISWRGFSVTGTASDRGVTVSTLRPSILYASAAPTGGTWTAGDVTINTAKTASSIDHWTCTSGGSPGTWTPSYVAYAAGSGLSQSGGTISHATGALAAGTYGGGSNFINSVTVDQFDHVTAVTTGAPTGSGGVTLAGSEFSSVVASSTTGPVTAYSYSMPGGQISAAPQKLNCWFSVTHAANTNSAVAQMQIGGTAVLTRTSAVSGEAFVGKVELVRKDATSMRGLALGYSATGVAVGPIAINLSGLNFANPIAINLLLGTGNPVSAGTTANGDINSESMRCEYWP